MKVIFNNSRLVFKGLVNNFNPDNARRGKAVILSSGHYYVMDNASFVSSEPMFIPTNATKVVYSGIQASDAIRFLVSKNTNDSDYTNVVYGDTMNQTGSGEIILTSEMTTEGKYITMSVYRGDNAANVDLSDIIIGFV